MQGANLKVPLRLEDIIDFTPMPKEYPAAENDERFILVDLSEQFLGAYELTKNDVKAFWELTIYAS